MTDPVLTTSAGDRTRLLDALDGPGVLVVGLCAAWCNTCGEFSQAFRAVANDHPGMHFLWLDVEDDEDVTSEIDIETFPTLAVYAQGRPLHFGTSLPQEGVLRRMVRTFEPDGPSVPVVEGVRTLPQVLRQRVVAAAR